MVLQIGQQVKVVRLKDRVSGSVAGLLGKNGVIKQFKMVDGSGVGLVVEFADQSSTWFFEDELTRV